MSANLPPPGPPPGPPPPPSPFAPPFRVPVDRRPRPSPGMATAALVCGIVGLFAFFVVAPSIVALVLGLVAWSRARAAPGIGDGRGQALAGWILGLVGVAGFVAFVIGAIVTSDEDDELTTINDVRVGQCVDVELDAGELASVQHRDCDQPHDAEVNLVRRIDGIDEFPGQGDLDRRGRTACVGSALDRYVGERSADGTLSPLYVVPSEETWQLGDRTIVCLITRVDDHQLTSSVAAN
jgi:hypothetical protein